MDSENTFVVFHVENATLNGSVAGGAHDVSASPLFLLRFSVTCTGGRTDLDVIRERLNGYKLYLSDDLMAASLELAHTKLVEAQMALEKQKKEHHEALERVRAQSSFLRADNERLTKEIEQLQAALRFHPQAR